jgi:hypothetical protein
MAQGLWQEVWVDSSRNNKLRTRGVLTIRDEAKQDKTYSPDDLGRVTRLRTPEIARRSRGLIPTCDKRNPVSQQQEHSGPTTCRRILHPKLHKN